MTLTGLRLLASKTNDLSIGWANALSKVEGCKALLWDMKAKPAFDIFDEFKPNIVLCQAKDINRALFKCIMENRERLKVFLWLSNLGSGDWVNRASDAEIETVDYLNKNCNVIGLCPVDHEMMLSNTHYQWNRVHNINIMSSLPASTVTEGKIDETLVSDICYVGEETELSHELILPLLNYKYIRVKIFSKVDWGVPNHVGYLKGQRVADAYRSARLSLCLPATKSLWDINESVYNCLASGGVPLVSEYGAAKRIFPQEHIVKIINADHILSLLYEGVSIPKEAKLQPSYLDRIKEALASYA